MGPSGMTTEHFKVLLDEPRALHSFFMVEQLSQVQVPTDVDFVRLGRLTALSKPDGGVRGLMAGDVVRRLVARTISQQVTMVVEEATRPTSIRDDHEGQVGALCTHCKGSLSWILKRP